MNAFWRASLLLAATSLATASQAGHLTRTEIGDGIAHYQFELRVGPAEFDVVRVHRVVREREPYRPVRTRGAVFMLHGAQLTFEAIFLRPGTSDATPETSAAVYLATHDIDVFGMDYGWTRVPIDASDFSFMADWGVERDANHALKALGTARLLRALTGQGFGRLNLLGYSYGVSVAYAAAGLETQRSRFHRRIGGLIAVDAAMKYDVADELSRLNVCADAAGIRALIDAGDYANTDGAAFLLFSDLAANLPDGPSPLVPGLTNFQAILFVGVNTFLLGPPPAPFWHFVGGTFDASGLPDGLLYSDPARWIGLLGSLPPYMPRLANYELRASICNEEDVSIDDHLADIAVPILYVGAEGGFGTVGDFTSSLTASRDITNYTVSLKPPEQRSIDFGHGDLFLGDDASSLAWDVIRAWLVEHDGRRRPRR